MVKIKPLFLKKGYLFELFVIFHYSLLPFFYYAILNMEEVESVSER